MQTMFNAIFHAAVTPADT